MNDNLNLVVMLTHNDRTVENAYEIFSQNKDAPAQYWGFKEEPLDFKEMKQLFAYMKECGKTTFLEVVAYSEAEGLEGARAAVECGCDILMGTIFSDSICQYCIEHHLKYMPFVGTVTERPSILNGTLEDMITEANTYLEKGAYGLDLLGYRYTGNAVQLNKRFVSQINAPVCIAGSVNSFQRLDELKAANPWAFTIGGAFFEKKFGATFKEQINIVHEYMHSTI